VYTVKQALIEIFMGRLEEVYDRNGTLSSQTEAALIVHVTWQWRRKRMVDSADSENTQGGRELSTTPTRALVPRTLEFYGDELEAIQTPDRQIWLNLPKLVACLGLRYDEQLDVIRNNRVIKEEKALRQFTMQTRQGGRPLYFLRLGLVPFYLARIDVDRVREELQPKILQYQTKAAEVLYVSFLGEFGIIEPGREQNPNQLTPAERDYQQAQLLANVARRQLELEREVGSVAVEVGNVSEQMVGQREVLALYGERIDDLELSIGKGDKITESQAAELKEMVKSIIEFVAERTASANRAKKAKETAQSLWTRFYRHFGVRIYPNLPRSRFPEAVQFFEEIGTQYGMPRPALSREEHKHGSERGKRA
jgi:hypothetical protein